MNISETMPGVLISDRAGECSESGEKCERMEENEEPHPRSNDELDVPDMGAQTEGSCADFLFVDSMLNHLAKSRIAPFKSQQVGDPDLEFSEKKEIARDILKDNPAKFLEKFGYHLLEDHLDYFSTVENTTCTSKNYEIDFHVKRLKRFHSKARVDVRNRRYEALKKLIDGGEYFSEDEMKKRNPLMYEQLIGQYLTPQEKEDKYKASTKQSRSYVVHLMGQIEDHYVNCLKKKQQEDEDQEEMDTSDEEEIREAEFVPVKEKDNDDIEEFDTSDESEGGEAEADSQVRTKEVKFQRRGVSDEEKDLLREEFVNNMYESFLEGNDDDFDYSVVDTNPEYECLAVRTQDEEEQYFDSETPELVKSGNITPVGVNDDEEEEDELDKFMRNLNSST